jgi:hypothetical protein
MKKSTLLFVTVILAPASIIKISLSDVEAVGKPLFVIAYTFNNDHSCSALLNGMGASGE